MAKDRPVAFENVFESWWRQLNDGDDEGKRGAGSNRAGAARLRRVGVIETDLGPRIDVAVALTVDAFRDLHRRLARKHEASLEWEERLVVAAVTLAHVREDRPGQKTAALLGGANPESRLMAEPRFLRLLRVKTAADLLVEGRRIAALLPKAPVGDLGASLMVWLGDADRRRIWAQLYYGLNSPSAAAAPNENQSEIGVLQP